MACAEAAADLAQGAYLRALCHGAVPASLAVRLARSCVDCVLIRVWPVACSTALTDNGVRSAAAAGMRTVMVPDLLPPTDETREMAFHVAKDLLEVRDLLTAQA